MVKSWVNLTSDWLFHSCAANQEPACLLTQLLTMTTTHKFPSLGKGGGGVGRGGGETDDAAAHHDRQEAVKVGRPRHVDDGVELGKVGVPVQVDDGGQGLQSGGLDIPKKLSYRTVGQFFRWIGRYLVLCRKKRAY